VKLHYAMLRRAGVSPVGAATHVVRPYIIPTIIAVVIPGGCILAASYIIWRNRRG